MGHYAKVENGIVTQVIVAEQEFIDSLLDGAMWVQTSYNTRGNVHYDADGLPDGGQPLRYNYAGTGYTYDPARDAFIPPEPVDVPDGMVAVLNEQSCLWDLVPDPSN